MANKGTFWDDTFEKALEAGQSMAKSGGKQLKQTFNPANMLKNAFSAEGTADSPAEALRSGGTKEGVKGAKGTTPLDFAKLQEKYQNQDKSKTDALRNKLFQMVKSGDEKIMMEKKQKEEEKKRQEAYQEHEKKRKEAEKQRQSQISGEPQGKERQSILAPKKKKKTQLPSTAEIKPSTGKQ
ncbi:hypothetical protein HZC27_04020 [Candidatus Roizmanbacteria bacterium]|nr:hypothetical protein [Candidatus Roizmanbacteria bacterium]